MSVTWTWASPGSPEALSARLPVAEVDAMLTAPTNPSAVTTRSTLLIIDGASFYLSRDIELA